MLQVPEFEGFLKLVSLHAICTELVAILLTNDNTRTTYDLKHPEGLILVGNSGRYDKICQKYKTTKTLVVDVYHTLTIMCTCVSHV